MSIDVDMVFDFIWDVSVRVIDFWFWIFYDY